MARRALKRPAGVGVLPTTVMPSIQCGAHEIDNSYCRWYNLINIYIYILCITYDIIVLDTCDKVGL